MIKKEIITDTSIYTDEFGNVHDINEDIEQAEADIQAMKQTASVTFRWSEFEIRRAKAIAKKIGIPYQTYIKMSLKQAMDNDEKKYNVVQFNQIFQVLEEKKIKFVVASGNQYFQLRSFFPSHYAYIIPFAAPLCKFS